MVGIQDSAVARSTLIYPSIIERMVIIADRKGIAGGGLARAVGGILIGIKGGSLLEIIMRVLTRAFVIFRTTGASLFGTSSTEK